MDINSVTGSSGTIPTSKTESNKNSSGIHSSESQGNNIKDKAGDAPKIEKTEIQSPSLSKFAQTFEIVKSIVKKLIDTLITTFSGCLQDIIKTLTDLLENISKEFKTLLPELTKMYNAGKETFSDLQSDSKKVGDML